VGRDCAPHLTTLRFAPGAGVIVFETSGKSQETRNLER
jgi:hypothetical protein